MKMFSAEFSLNLNSDLSVVWTLEQSTISSIILVRKVTFANVDFVCLVCLFIPELGFGPLCLDHPSAVYTMCGSALGAYRCEQLLRTGDPDSAGHHSGLALTEDGTTPVGKHYHTSNHIMEHKQGLKFLGTMS